MIPLGIPKRPSASNFKFVPQYRPNPSSSTPSNSVSSQPPVTAASTTQPEPLKVKVLSSVAVLSSEQSKSQPTESSRQTTSESTKSDAKSTQSTKSVHFNLDSIVNVSQRKENVNVSTEEDDEFEVVNFFPIHGKNHKKAASKTTKTSGTDVESSAAVSPAVLSSNKAKITPGASLASGTQNTKLNVGEYSDLTTKKQDKKRKAATTNSSTDSNGNKAPKRKKTPYSIEEQSSSSVTTTISVNTKENEVSISSSSKDKPISKRKKKSTSYHIFPHSYNNPTNYQKITTYLKLSPAGITGIIFSNLDNRAVITGINKALYESSQNAKYGLQENDVILSVNHLDGKYSNFEQLMIALNHINCELTDEPDKFPLQESTSTNLYVNDMNNPNYSSNRSILKNAIIESMACVVFARVTTITNVPA